MRACDPLRSGLLGPWRTRARHLFYFMFKKPHVRISGGLFCDLFSVSLLSTRSCCCSKSLIWGSLAAFFVISSLFSLLASLCALLSSLFSLLPSLFSHPSLLSSLFSLLSLLSSLFSRCCSFLRSHFALLTSNFASGHRIRFQLNPLDPLPHHPWPGGMREAIK